MRSSISGEPCPLQSLPRDVESTVLQQPIPGGYDTFSEYEVRYTYADGIKLNIRNLDNAAWIDEVNNRKYKGMYFSTLGFAQLSPALRAA